MAIIDNINGYLRLYCKIKEIPAPPKRCRVCNGELDTKWKARQHGYLCLKCLREKRRLTKQARWVYYKNGGSVG